jgi:hypothetical protein
MFNIGSEVEDAEYINCYWEGADGVTPVNSPNYLPKDGFSNYSGKNSLFFNCTGAKTGIETLYVGWQDTVVNVDASTQTIIKPAVGGTLTFNVIDTPPIFFENQYIVNDIICLSNPYNFSNPVGLGFYRINTITDITGPNPNLNVHNYQLVCTRVSGADISDPVGYLNKGNIFLSAGQRYRSGFYVTKANIDRTYNVTVSVINCTFIGGEYTVPEAYANSYYDGLCSKPFQDPAIRLLTGKATIKNNIFDKVRAAYTSNNESSNYTNCNMQYNIIGVTNTREKHTPQYAYRDADVFNYNAISIDTYQDNISNNTFTLWDGSELSGNMSRSNIGYPDSRPWFTGVIFNAFGVGYNQNITNNIFNINIPLSAYIVLPLYSQFGSNQFTDICGEPIKNFCINLQTQRSNNIINYTNANDFTTLRTISWYDGNYPDSYSTRITGYILSAYVNDVNGSYIFNSASTAADNNINVIKPTFINIGSPGRWIRQG